MKTKRNHLIRLAKFTIEEIFAWMTRTLIRGRNLPKGRAWLYGQSVKYRSSRLRMFLDKGIHCVYCGRKATHFILEQSKYDNNNGLYHLNLYARNLDGSETLMTQDHLIPVCRGGTNRQTNLAPACEYCNTHKGKSMPRGKWQPKYLKKDPNHPQILKYKLREIKQKRNYDKSLF